MTKQPTQKQIKLIKAIVENLGSKKNTKTMGELMLEVGYSEAQSKNPYQIVDGDTIQDGISDFLKSLDDKRKMAITQITKKKLEKSSARDLGYVADILTKNHQLLSGGATERNEVSEISIRIKK